jgi:hypothetical protein
MERYEREYNRLIKEYKILYRDVRLEYQFYKHENMKPEIKRVIEKENEINDFLLNMIQDIITGSQTDTDPLGNMKQLQSEWNEQQKEQQIQTGSLLAAERRNDIIHYNLNRERIFFFTNMVFICLFVFYIIHQERSKDIISPIKNENIGVV